MNTLTGIDDQDVDLEELERETDISGFDAIEPSMEDIFQQRDSL